MVRRGLTFRGALLPTRQQRNTARYLVVTEGSLAGTRVTLGTIRSCSAAPATPLWS